MTVPIAGLATDSHQWLRASGAMLEAAGGSHPRMAARLFNRPLMLMPAVAELIAGNLVDRLAGSDVALPRAAPAFPGDSPAERTARRALARHDGVAVIDVVGELVHDTHGSRPFSGLLLYQSVAADLAEALGDDATRAILLRVNSPGGEVAGAFDLADAIRAAGAAKPTAAIASDTAASAGYLLASAAGRLFVTQSARVGSVGVIATLWDVSRARAARGVAVTVLHAGARKADGHPEIPLGDPARAAIQGELDRFMDLFVAKVAGNRGIGGATVRAWEAGVFVGADAIAAGLADAVATEAEALAWLRAQVASGAGEPAFQTPSGAGGAGAKPAARHSRPRRATRRRSMPNTQNPQGRSRRGRQPRESAETDAMDDGDDRGDEEAKAAAGDDDAGAMDDGDRGDGDQAVDAMDGDGDDAETEGRSAQARLRIHGGRGAPRAAGGRAAGYSEAREIVGLCALAGHPEKAAGYLARNMSRRGVQAALTALRAEGGGATSTSAVPGAGATRGGVAAAGGGGYLANHMRGRLEARGLKPAGGVPAR